MRTVKVHVLSVDLAEDIALINAWDIAQPTMVHEFVVHPSSFAANARNEAPLDTDQLWRNVSASLAMSGLPIAADNLPAIVAYIEAQEYQL